MLGSVLDCPGCEDYLDHLATSPRRRDLGIFWRSLGLLALLGASVYAGMALAPWLLLSS